MSLEPDYDYHDSIIAKYPKLYSHCRHFECGPGWWPLLDDLSSLLQEEIDKGHWKESCVEDIIIDSDYQPYVAQVKEKYGSLRFYMYSATDAMHEIIEKCEHKSSITCELCGKPGAMNYEAWKAVRCKECKKK